MRLAGANYANGKNGKNGRINARRNQRCRPTINYQDFPLLIPSWTAPPYICILRAPPTAPKLDSNNVCILRAPPNPIREFSCSLHYAKAYPLPLSRGRLSPLQVSSLQLLHHQAPQAAFLILVASPFFDDTGDLFAMVVRAFQGAVHSAQGEEAGATGSAGVPGAADGGAGVTSLFWAGMVLLSCLLAFLVNLSTFLVIGKTSPVSYQVLMGTGTVERTHGSATSTWLQ